MVGFRTGTVVSLAIRILDHRGTKEKGTGEGDSYLLYEFVGTPPRERTRSRRPSEYNFNSG